MVRPASSARDQGVRAVVEGRADQELQVPQLVSPERERQ
jgi:hypothetical protein